MLIKNTAKECGSAVNFVNDNKYSIYRIPDQ